MSLDEACKRYDFAMDDFLRAYREFEDRSYLPLDVRISVSLSIGQDPGAPRTVYLRYLC